MNSKPTNQPPTAMTPQNIEDHLNAFRDRYNAAMPATVNPSGLQDVAFELAQAVKILIGDIKSKPNDTRYLTSLKVGANALLKYDEFRFTTPPSQPLGIEGEPKELSRLYGELNILTRLRSKLGREEILDNGEWITIDDKRDKVWEEIQVFTKATAASQSSTEEEKDLWDAVIDHYEETELGRSKFIEQLQSTYKISKR